MGIDRKPGMDPGSRGESGQCPEQGAPLRQRHQDRRAIVRSKDHSYLGKLCTQDGDHIGGDPKVGSRITSRTKPTSTFISSSNATKKEATGGIKDISPVVPNARASC